MRSKWIALTFLFGLIITLDPSQTPAQMGGKGQGGKKGRGNGGDPNGFQMPKGGANPGDAGGGGPPGGGPGGGNKGGGGGPGGGGRGGMMAMMGNPETMWGALQNMTQGDGQTLDLSRINDQMRGMFTRMGVPLPDSGMLSKDQLAGMMAMAQNGGGVNRMNGPNGMGNNMMMMRFDPNSMNNMNMNGFGNWGQPPEGWDSNDRSNKDNEKGGRGRNEKKEEERPIAIRYGKLPKDAPDWFETDDIDKDGQIALWEWRKAGKSIAEFSLYDLDGDGFITADEYLRAKQQDDEDKKNKAYENGEKPRSDRGKGGAGGPGGRGPGGPGGGRGPGGGPPGNWDDNGDNGDAKPPAEANNRPDRNGAGNGGPGGGRQPGGNGPGRGAQPGGNGNGRQPGGNGPGRGNNNGGGNNGGRGGDNANPFRPGQEQDN